MAKQFICDTCNDLPATHIIGDLTQGEQKFYCALHAVEWAQNMVDMFNEFLKEQAGDQGEQASDDNSGPTQDGGDRGDDQPSRKPSRRKSARPATQSSAETTSPPDNGRSDDGVAHRQLPGEEAS